MAIVENQTPNIFYYSNGAGDIDADFVTNDENFGVADGIIADGIIGGFNATHLKIVITAGTLHISFEGAKVFGIFTTGTHEFHNIQFSRIWFKSPASDAVIQMWAWD